MSSQRRIIRNRPTTMRSPSPSPRPSSRTPSPRRPRVSPSPRRIYHPRSLSSRTSSPIRYTSPRISVSPRTPPSRYSLLIRRQPNRNNSPIVSERNSPQNLTPPNFVLGHLQDRIVNEENYRNNLANAN